MGLFTSIFGLPLAPVRGVVAVAEALQEQAERELGDRVRIRHELEDAEAAVEAGEIAADEADEARRSILQPLVEARAPKVTTGPESHQRG